MCQLCWYGINVVIPDWYLYYHRVLNLKAHCEARQWYADTATLRRHYEE